MQTLFKLFNPQPYIILPPNLLDWAGLVVLLLLLFIGIIKFRGHAVGIKRKQIPLIAGFAILVVIANLFAGLHIVTESITNQGFHPGPFSPLMMIFSAVPWIIASGLVGFIPAVGLAAFGGFIRSLWETHNLSIIIFYALLAIIIFVIRDMGEKTKPRKIFLHPLGCSIALIPFALPLFQIFYFIEAGPGIPERLDQAFSIPLAIVVSKTGELLIGGVIAEIIFLFGKRFWKSTPDWGKNPEKRRLQDDFPVWLGLTIYFFFFIFGTISWQTAKSYVKRDLENQFMNLATTFTGIIDPVLEAGRQITESHAEIIQKELSKQSRFDPGIIQFDDSEFFSSGFLFDTQGNLIDGYPNEDLLTFQPTLEESAGMRLAFQGIPYQMYMIPPEEAGDPSSTISYIQAILDEDAIVVGALLERVVPSENPLVKPILNSMEKVISNSGGGAVLDENNRVFYSTITNEEILQFRNGLQNNKIIEKRANNLKPQLIYSNQFENSIWQLILQFPHNKFLDLTLLIAKPFLISDAIFSIILFFTILWRRRRTKKMFQVLVEEATRTSEGTIGEPLSFQFDFEVGGLVQAFERMRLILQTRLNEVNRYLRVSRMGAVHLEIWEAIGPILQEALIQDASTARVIFIDDVTMDKNGSGFVSIGIGPKTEVYAPIDRQIFELTEGSPIVLIPNMARTKRLGFGEEQIRPAAMLSCPIRQENKYLGALWIGFETPHNFSNEEVRSIQNLADQALMAAVNSRLFVDSEINRRRLEAVLGISSDPILVIDDKNQVIFLNQAALELPGLVNPNSPGKDIREKIASPELQDIISNPAEGNLPSKEVRFQNERVFLLSGTPVMLRKRPVGKVYSLRDISHERNLDILKSDFVSTVSHDLRTPLTLVRGYATMLQMIGDLNEQQKVYVEKIIKNVENMTRLVRNLLDLGRIESGIGLQIERVSANELLDEVINLLQPQAVQKNIKVNRETINDIPTNPEIMIEVDRALIQQALFNLIDNAIKFTKVGGQINFRLIAKENNILYEIKDSGIGIAALDIPHIFERFYRNSGRETNRSGGTGLGLVIVKSIVDRHGGRVRVESQLGRGSVFSVELPVRVK